jgi:hypothetical protein
VIERWLIFYLYYIFLYLLQEKLSIAYQITKQILICFHLHLYTIHKYKDYRNTLLVLWEFRNVQSKENYKNYQYQWMNFKKYTSSVKTYKKNCCLNVLFFKQMYCMFTKSSDIAAKLRLQDKYLSYLYWFREQENLMWLIKTSPIEKSNAFKTRRA